MDVNVSRVIVLQFLISASFGAHAIILDAYEIYAYWEYFGHYEDEATMLAEMGNFYCWHYHF